MDLIIPSFLVGKTESDRQRPGWMFQLQHFPREMTPELTEGWKSELLEMEVGGQGYPR